MKKLFVLFAAATLFVGVQACKNQATEETATEETTEVTTEAPADSTATAVVDSAATTAADTAVATNNSVVENRNKTPNLFGVFFINF
jgi:hypothetical protein